jgi:hypothetical protein
MNHRFQKGVYFTECSRCGAREHWTEERAIMSSECSGVRVDRGEVPLFFAESAIGADLRAFVTWWQARTDLPAHLPSIEEWRAEFLAWSLKRSPNSTPTKDETT